VRVLRERFGNAGDDAFQVLEDLVVPEAQNRPTLSFEKRRPATLVRNRVLTAIQFDNQPAFRAREIDDIRTYRRLATELATQEAPVAKLEPELPLDISLKRSQTSRALGLLSKSHRRTPSPACGRGLG
jgi:hypothetical protein